MTTPIPNGYGLAVVTMTCVGSTRISQFTFGFLEDPLQTPAQHHGGIYNALTQVGKPLAAEDMSEQWTFANLKILLRGSIGDLRVHEQSYSLEGGTGGSPVPMNSALLIHKRTGLAGRHAQGRMFIPPAMFAESDVSAAGIIDATTLGSMQTRWNSFLTALTSAGFNMVLLHADGTLPFPVLTLQLSPKVGTLKRRLRA